ncbi:MAG: DEAD/SNF2-like helicase [Hyperionvirus sp.]|uniref:DEAD/SNF2-like helicase n=1 Tax=Hyperionvirus sp. TaxID=2487770 RepID=A0A3G5A8N7_9VIRU|nr:MAG: DEAD/SNF2-like helicase [Hyperionvirus sp.]
MISGEVKKNLFDFQLVHVNNLIRIIKNNSSLLDASDTGTGKTYTAVAVCKILKLRPIIVCPKSVISTWVRVCKFFGLEEKFIVNYETIIRGKYYTKERDRVVCPYIKVLKEKKEEVVVTKYKWNVEEEGVVFIFDEAHRCAKLDTYNGQVLFAAKETGVPMMILSATIADYPEKFRLFFYVLNFIDPVSVRKNKINFGQYMNIVTKWVVRDPQPMLKIHNMLYPQRASRMRIDAIPSFPETQITAEPYTLGKKREEEIEEQYSIISTQLDELKNKSVKDKANVLVKIMRAHQKIEIIKIPIFVELANDLLVNGYSVVIFVNFTQTLKTLEKMLGVDTFIHGGQTAEERDRAIEMFNENKRGIIICNIKAGSVGISLHDIHGGHPRASLLSPTWSSIDLKQALGRIHRAGAKSKSLQRIIYAANTVEEKIADKLKEKLKNINTINNGDLSLNVMSDRIEFKER